jgi:hypothetical protein
MTPSDADSVVAPVGFCAFTKNARSTSRMPLRPPVQLAARQPIGRALGVILCVPTNGRYRARHDGAYGSLASLGRNQWAGRAAIVSVSGRRSRPCALALRA